MVWRPPAGQAYSHGIWAPELHFLRGKWYIYFGADAGTNARTASGWSKIRRPRSARGEWTPEGQGRRPCRSMGHRCHRVRDDGARFTWCGRDGGARSTAFKAWISRNFPDPWTVKGRRVRISTPEYPWEKIGDQQHEAQPRRESRGEHLAAAHRRERRPRDPAARRAHFPGVFRGAPWTDFYELGMLTATARKRPLDPALVAEEPGAGLLAIAGGACAYGPGHNSFFPIARPQAGLDSLPCQPGTRTRVARGTARRARSHFTWKPDGTPDFGRAGFDLDTGPGASATNRQRTAPGSRQPDRLDSG